MPKDKNAYGYLSEHHAFGQTFDIAGDYAEDLAATMLVSPWASPSIPTRRGTSARKSTASGTFFRASHHVQSVEGHKDGLWTTAIAAAVFIT